LRPQLHRQCASTIVSTSCFRHSYTLSPDVLYHALQGADTISQYQQDADGDSELSQFFEQTRSSYALVAQQAKQLLAARLESDDDDEDDDDDSEE
jgi:hypothetical protein